MVQEGCRYINMYATVMNVSEISKNISDYITRVQTTRIPDYSQQSVSGLPYSG